MRHVLYGIFAKAIVSFVERIAVLFLMFHILYSLVQHVFKDHNDDSMLAEAAATKYKQYKVTVRPEMDYCENVYIQWLSNYFEILFIFVADDGIKTTNSDLLLINQQLLSF